MAGLMHTVVKPWPLFTPSGSSSWGMVLYYRTKKEKEKILISNSAGKVDWKGGSQEAIKNIHILTFVTKSLYHNWAFFGFSSFSRS